ncbi:hypothetical protein B0H17DRAFT_871041, partial [Mycena rosella]
KQFEHILDGLSGALDFRHTIGVESGPSSEQGGGRRTVGVELTPRSHEGPMLEYEQTLTRAFPVPSVARTAPQLKVFYNTSAHFPWIGDRAR